MQGACFFSFYPCEFRSSPLFFSFSHPTNILVVVDSYDMCLRSAYVAVLYMDQFLNHTHGVIDPEKGQLLVAACLHVASKCEDVSYIGVEELGSCTDHL